MPTPSNRRNANRARCQFVRCDKFAQTQGLCKAHGGGSRCRDPQCNKLAQSRGLCIAHGGGRRCQFDGCKKLAQSKGYCISHGGGRRCTIPNCEKFSQVKGRCKSHSKLSPSRGVVTPSSFPYTATTSPTSVKLSIDFLLSRSASIGDKMPSQQPILQPDLHPTTNAFTSGGTSCNLRHEKQVLGNKSSLLSFLESYHVTPSLPTLKPQYLTMTGRYAVPMLPSLTIYR